MKTAFKASVAVFAALALVICSLAPIHILAATPPTGPTNISATTPIGPYPSSVSAGTLGVTWTGADTTNGNSAALTGHEVLCWQNTDSASHTITLTSVADNLGRTNDITSYSVAATGSANSQGCFSFLTGTTGWRQSDGTVHFSSNSALVQFLVLYVQR